MLDMLTPILFYLNDARADQCESRLRACETLNINLYKLSSLPVLKTKQNISPVCVRSPARPHAHRRLHPAAAEWRKKLWRPSEQAVRSPCAHGHSCVHRNPRRPAHSGETLWREINERIYFFHLSTNEGRKSCVWQKETEGWSELSVTW